MATQIFVLEFSKDVSADLGDEFADGGAANQPVILQQGAALLQMCPFLSSNQDANQNIKLNKNQKYSKLMYKVSPLETSPLSFSTVQGFEGSRA